MSDQGPFSYRSVDADARFSSLPTKVEWLARPDHLLSTGRQESETDVDFRENPAMSGELDRYREDIQIIARPRAAALGRANEHRSLIRPLGALMDCMGIAGTNHGWVGIDFCYRENTKPRPEGLGFCVALGAWQRSAWTRAIRPKGMLGMPNVAGTTPVVALGGAHRLRRPNRQDCRFVV